VQACWSEMDEEELEELRDEMLVDRSLLRRTEAGHYRLHQLLREFFGAKRRQMVESEGWDGAFLDVMIAEANRSCDRPRRSLLEETTAVMPHLQGAIEWAEDMEQLLKVSRGKDRLANLYKSQGRYGEAEPLLLQVLEILEHLGGDHPDVAASLNNLAELYRTQGRYSDAEALYIRSLSILEQQLGFAHSYHAATTVNNLALLYKSQRRYSDAEHLWSQLLFVQESQLEANHSDIALSLNNLAGLYYAQSRYSEAEPLYARALSIWEAQLGSDHPRISDSLNNLAAL
jgi:tetratricopeptide (TPR) repeat protein